MKKLTQKHLRHDYKMKAEVCQWLQIINVYVFSLGIEHGLLVWLLSGEIDSLSITEM
jgi:hypothetical protein